MSELSESSRLAPSRHQEIEQIEKKFVARYVQFKPLFNRNEVNRDNFIKLRKELIALGCSQDEVISIAKKLSMEVLNIDSEEEYHKYIMYHTFDTINRIIKEGYSDTPIQDLNNLHYSHTGLFSSIYGFELNYFASRKINEGIFDIGCGDGLFLQLLTERGFGARGYEVQIKETRHSVKIDKISDVEDIEEPGNALILNHVLEHIDECPSDFIRRAIAHFERLLKDKLQSIIISLPVHLNIHAHLASDHKWFCWNDEISDETRKTFERSGLRLFRPADEFSHVAKEKGYQFKMHENLGVYVFE